jgi:GT2 family glycosyltransferase
MGAEVPRPRVSVVIPCHDQGHLLADAVRGASARTAHVDVIVVDNGSTDHTAMVARGLRDVMLIRQNRGGDAAAMNRGLRAALSDYVIFLHPADRLLPGGIDAGVRAMAANPSCVMAYGRCLTIGSDGQLWPAPDVPTVRSGHHAALLHTNLIWTPAVAIFRREAVAAIGGFREEFDGAADYDLYLRLSRDGTIHDHGRPVAACRRGQGSWSGAADRMLRDTLAVMHSNRPDSDVALSWAWRDGYRAWQDVYGALLVDEVRAHVHEHDFSGAGRKLLVLAWLAPRTLLRELGRTLRGSSAAVGAPRRATTR